MTLEQHFQVGHMLFICGFWVSLREVIYWVDVFICYFLYKVPIFFGFVLEFIFERKVLQEDLLASLTVCQVFVLCCLYFKFSDEGVGLEFPESYLTFFYVFALFCEPWFIVVLGIVLFAMLMRVLVKCIMGSS